MNNCVKRNHANLDGFTYKWINLGRVSSHSGQIRIHHNKKSRMSVSSMRFGHFSKFRPKVCFSASGSKRFKILPFSFNSLTPSIFLN
ncbi:hypothetical protein Hanom_Chr13g01218071 [Helianthus anomalus]